MLYPGESCHMSLHDQQNVGNITLLLKYSLMSLYSNQQYVGVTAHF